MKRYKPEQIKQLARAFTDSATVVAGPYKEHDYQHIAANLIANRYPSAIQKRREKTMLNSACIHDVSDDDCYKCFKRGIIFRCPNPCPDFSDGREEEDETEKTRLQKKTEKAIRIAESFEEWKRKIAREERLHEETVQAFVKQVLVR